MSLHLKPASLNWALRSVDRYHDSYLFPRPFEFDAIKALWPQVREWLVGRDLLNYDAGGVRKYRKVLTATSRLGFRIATQLDPVDSIITNAILYEIAPDLERARFAPSRATSFSFRLKPNVQTGSLFDPEFAWKTFHRETMRIAASGRHEYVIATDIADFYPSIYLHHLETVLRDAVAPSGRRSHAESLLNYVRAMNDSQTHKGLPIGPLFARPLAELVIDVIDRVLTERGMTFTRYVDDIHIFCASERDAYEKLAHLSLLLYEQRNFKLNSQKTSILPVDQFTRRYAFTHEDKQKESMEQNFKDLMEELGLAEDPYSESEFPILAPHDLQRLEALNLERMLESHLRGFFVEYPFLASLLRGLASMGNANAIEIVFHEDHRRSMVPVLRSLVNYVKSMKALAGPEKEEIGGRVLEMMKDPVVGALPFNRAWLLSIFAGSAEWGSVAALSKLAITERDPLTQRELMLAVGRAHGRSYFQTRKHAELPSDPWVRRAFLAGISCLPKDELRPWYKAQRLTDIDFLDGMVIEWAEKSRF